MTRRVLETTLEELGRVGLAALSLPRVASLAGINKTSLYRRWPTKEALVTDALGLAVPAPPRLPDRGSLELDLADLAGQLAAFVTSPGGRGVLRTLFADGALPSTRRLTRAMRRRSLQPAPRAVLERALARGELGDDVDQDLLLYTLAGAVLHRTFVEQGRADQAWARRVARLLARGAAPRVLRGRRSPARPAGG